SDVEMVLAGHRDAVNMIEVGAREVSEQVVADGIAFGFQVIKEICELIQELAAKVGVQKQWTPPAINHALRDRISSMAREKLRAAKRNTRKQERNDAVTAIYDEVLEAISPKSAEKPEIPRDAVNAELQRLEEEVVRKTILEEGIRPDGRGHDDIRQIKCEVGVLPRTHGSALFSRGETQALVVVTLGTSRDEQIIDALG